MMRKPGVTIVVTNSKNKPTFRINGKSEPIMVVKKGEEEIKVHIGDTVKIGLGIYRIVDYLPNKEWKRNPYETVFHPSVKCELIKGSVLYDFRRVSYYDREEQKVYIELSPETLSYFVISVREKNEIVQKKREEIARKIEEYEKRQARFNQQNYKNLENPEKH